VPSAADALLLQQAYGLVDSIPLIVLRGMRPSSVAGKQLYHSTVAYFSGDLTIRHPLNPLPRQPLAAAFRS
jgi:hypothetical protein